ncbi:MAG: hypothetical protein JXA33_27085 [Anaerolineae bacterium]|nr:hypothetical protein [Anaerolineae bacterium]
MSELIDLHKHCFILSGLLAEVYQILPSASSASDISWLSAGDWLKIAAGVEKVEINTSRFDETVMWCSSAWEYESKRSELLTQIATHLTTFNFVWGSFESVIKIINPLQVPPSVKKRAYAIDNAIFYLKNEFDPSPRIPLYDDTLAQLRSVLHSHSQYQGLDNEFKIDSFKSMSGLGIHIVRIIRNNFAHGSAKFPEPNDWDSNAILDSESQHLALIEISSRIILLSIQMMLLAHFKSTHFTVECLNDEDGINYEEDIHVVLRMLHLNDYCLNPDQPRLFN